jgi:hypothetical protein
MLLILRLILELRHSPVAEGQSACSECVAVYGGEKVPGSRSCSEQASIHPAAHQPPLGTLVIFAPAGATVRLEETVACLCAVFQCV